MRAPLIGLLIALAGCSSPRKVDWRTDPDPADVQALRERIGPYLGPGGDACLATVFRERGDVAAALVLEEPAGARRDSLRAALPEDVTEEQLQGGEAALEAASAALAAGGQAELPALHTSSMIARAAYLDLGRAWRDDELRSADVDRALGLAPADWVVAQRLEALRGAGAFELGEDRERRWRRTLAGLALERGRPMVAIQHATVARDLARNDAERAQDGALLSRAQLGLGRGDEALLEAEVALKLARTPAERQELEALCGQAKLALGHAQDAAAAYARAERAAVEAGDESGALRHAINRVTAWLKGGEAELAREAVKELETMIVEPVGPDAPELLARRAIVSALAGLKARDIDVTTAASRVEEALEKARLAGAVSVLEAYSGVPERLRRGRP